ncbi:MAG: PAS domain S-box protein [Deltaproteobacteria bacterium]|nr:PAS domain S-box protein [Deltaproteobacteria bacterium]
MAKKPGRRKLLNNSDIGSAFSVNEDRYRSLFETVTDIIVLIDPEYVITDVSPSVEREAGYRPEEVIGISIHDVDFTTGEFRRSVFENLEKVFAGERISGVEYQLITRRGDVMYVEINATPLYRDCIVHACICVARNVTQRKRMEEEIRESGEKYRDLVENMRDIVYMTDDKGMITYVSPVIRELGGYEPSDIIGKRYVDFVFDEDLPDRWEYFTRALQGENENTEYRYVTRDGRVRWVRNSPRPIVKDGCVTGLQGNLSDITERKEVEESLRRSQEWLRTVLENMPVLLVAFDEREGIIVWNAECERVTGYTMEEARNLGNIWEALYPDPEYREWLLKETRHHRNEYYNLEVRITDRNGDVRTLSLSNISAQFPVPGWKFWAVGVDMTEIKKAEEVLRNMNAHLEHQVRQRTEELHMKAQKLEETNAALRTLLQAAEEFKEDMEMRVLSNVSQVTIPYLERLKRTRLSEDQMTYCTILDTHIRNITSSFAKRLSSPYLGFTPQEVRIATLIKEHKSTKDIAELLAISESAVIFHRHNIRKKLGIIGKKVNLEAHLEQFSQ